MPLFDQVSVDPSFWSDTVFKWGLGVAVLLAGFWALLYGGRLYAKATVDAITLRAEHAEKREAEAKADLKAANAKLQDAVLPAIYAATTTLTHVESMMKDVIELTRRQGDQLPRIEDTLRAVNDRLRDN